MSHHDGSVGHGSFWGDGFVGHPTMMDLWGIECFGVVEPIWGDGRHGMMGMAGCGVMELWGMAHFGAMGPQGCGSLWGDGAVGHCSFWGDGAVGCGSFWAGGAVERC